MGSIEYFDHTADVGLRVRAADLDNLFRTAAEGLFDLIVANRPDVTTFESERVDLEADGVADLLFAWLSELLFRSETGHRLYARFDVAVLGGGRSLRAEVGGEAIDRDRHVLDHEVKAVTRHAFRVEPEADGTWIAEVILDI